MAMGNLWILAIALVVIFVFYVVVVLIGMVQSRNEQIEGMVKYEEQLWDELREMTERHDELQANYNTVQSINMELSGYNREYQNRLKSLKKNMLESLEHQRKVIQELRLQMMVLEQDNDRLTNIDAKNTGLYYKIVDLSNENCNLKEEIKRLRKK